MIFWHPWTFPASIKATLVFRFLLAYYETVELMIGPRIINVVRSFQLATMTQPSKKTTIWTSWQHCNPLVRSNSPGCTEVFSLILRRTVLFLPVLCIWKVLPEVSEFKNASSSEMTSRKLRLSFPFCYRSTKENKREFVSGRESPASLVKRRRTTQVISVTMTKVRDNICRCIPCIPIHSITSWKYFVNVISLKPI